MTARERLAAFPARFDGIDKSVDRLWERGRGHPVVDRVMYTASEMGDFGVIWMGVGAVAALSGRSEHGRALVRLPGRWPWSP